MSELFETEFVAEDEDGVEIPLFETEDGELVDANGEFYGTPEDAELEDDEQGEYDPDAEFVAQAQQQLIQAMVANEVAAATDAYASPSYLSQDPEEEFEGDFHDMVTKLERERGARLLDSERDALWEAANEASEDPTMQTDAEVWKTAKQTVDDIDVAEYIDSRMRESDEQREEQEKDEPPEDQTPKELLADIEQDQEEYREALEAAVAGDGPSPFDEYEPPPEGD